MTSRIQYNSPKHQSKLISMSRPTSQLTQGKQKTPIKQQRNPESSKPFQRRQTFKALERKKSLQSEQKRKLQRESKTKESMIKGSEYFNNPISQMPQKIIKNYPNRQRRAGTQIFKSLDCLPSICISSNQNIHSAKGRQKIFTQDDQVKLMKQFNESLLKKNKILTESNIILKQKNEQLRCRVEILEQKCNIMEEQIQQNSQKEKKNIEEIKQQKSINRCLEDIILQLNARIQSLINQPDNMTQDTCDEAGHIGELQKENNSLKQQMLALNSQLQKYQLDITMLKREKYESEREKNLRERLQNQNKLLNRKLQDLQKAKTIVKVKSQGKLGKNSDLDYSVSFDLER